MEKRTRALLVGVHIDGVYYFNQSMKELGKLAEACNMEVVGTVTQNMLQVNRALYLGTGKVNEVKQDAKTHNAEVVIFNNELTPSQLRNLEEELDLPILDRTSLILQIFAIRARTKEAKLQVEVAKLGYMLPRLVGLHESLGRQGGSAGTANKGSGEKKLELDRRKIEAKLNELKKELEQLSEQRDIQRRKRKESEIPQVALVGYTNAGKSTLLNALVDIYQEKESKKVFEENMLFATLDTSIRNIELEDNKKFLISDTVGFVSDLPHSLVKAFRSTLEEIKEADLLLHVVDYSNIEHERHIEVTNQVLKELGVEQIPVIYVYNKADKVESKLPIIEDNKIYMSASNKIGLEELIDMIKASIFGDYKKCKLMIPYSRADILAQLNELATVEGIDYVEQGNLVLAEIREKDYHKFSEFDLNDKITEEDISDIYE